MRCLLLLVALVPFTLRAQNLQSPITRSLYLALGGDVLSPDTYVSVARSLSFGVEQSRPGSRWTTRLGANYMRHVWKTTDWRNEEFGVDVSARYGRRSGVVRPYLLGGVGIAHLHSQGTGGRYYPDPNSPSVIIVERYPLNAWRWNGSLTFGAGADVRFGPLKLFTEGRINAYPDFLGDPEAYRRSLTTRALYFGLRF
jgi:hypothetical protein